MGTFELQELMKPQLLHAASVHFPIVLALLGIPLLYVAAVSSTEKNTLLWMAFACYALLTVSGFLAARAGFQAAEHVPSNVAPDVSATLHRHEEMAEKVWMFGLGITILIFLGFIKIKLFRVIVMILAMLGSIALGGWVATTAHFGGMLVYKYGVGTPSIAKQEKETHPPNIIQDSPGTSPTNDALIPLREIDPKAAQEVSYKRDIKPLFERFCVDCHGNDSPKGGISLTSVASMKLSGRKSGPGIVPGNPDESSIVRYVRGEFLPRMPKGGPALSENDLHVIRCWIFAGAIDDTVSSPSSSEIGNPVGTSEGKK